MFKQVRPTERQLGIFDEIRRSVIPGLWIINIPSYLTQTKCHIRDKKNTSVNNNYRISIYTVLRNHIQIVFEEMSSWKHLTMHLGMK